MLSKLLGVVVVVCLAFDAAVAQDPTKVEPKHYQLAFENEWVQVVNVHYGPHEKSVMHSHPAVAAVFLTDSKGQFTYPDGKTKAFDSKAGDAGYETATTHLPENSSDTAMDLIVVELKGHAAKSKMAGMK